MSGVSIANRTSLPFTLPLTMEPLPTLPEMLSPPPVHVYVPPLYDPLKVVPFCVRFAVMPDQLQLMSLPLMFESDRVQVPSTVGVSGPVLSLPHERGWWAVGYYRYSLFNVPTRSHSGSGCSTTPM